MVRMCGFRYPDGHSSAGCTFVHAFCSPIVLEVSLDGIRATRDSNLADDARVFEERNMYLSCGNISRCQCLPREPNMLI